MMANRLMLNKQCLVPGQRPMNLIGAHSLMVMRLQWGVRCWELGGQVGPVGARSSQILMIRGHYQAHTRRVFPPTLSLHLTPISGRETDWRVVSLRFYVSWFSSAIATWNYFYNGDTDQPPAWDWQPSLLWHWWIYLLAELLRSVTREPTDNSKFRDNRVNSQPPLPWL